MKFRQNYFNFLIGVLCIFMVPVISISCDGDDDDVQDIILTLTGNANGAQEVPAVTTAATGTLTGSYNDNTNELSYTINWTGLSGNVVAAHFHGPAATGTNASPVIDLTVTTNGTNGNITGTQTLNATNEGFLKAGTLYYNLHTAANPGGEIRGQVSAN
ncbi:MAG: CHRD domain-containing protein [Chitinophagaceae bacterium]|jgi:hypothetical protein|nr:CHRD domain-containing protein [Chitinophagaceae bacterium]